MISVISIIQIWYIWFRIIRVRTLVVDFYKYKMPEFCDNHGDLLIDSEYIEKLEESTYIKNKEVRKKTNVSMGKILNKDGEEFHNFRFTRIKLDIIIPILFTIIWIAFFIYSYCFYF